MDIQELHDLILNDTIAKNAADSGNDTLCAERCREIAPKKIVSTMLGELGMFKIGGNPADVEAILQQIEAIAESNPVIKRLLKWIQPGAPGIDFGDLRVRQLLTLPINEGGIGLTQQQAQPFLSCAEKSQYISTDMIGEAWRQYRN